jgi:hypothetical protein
MKRIHSSNSLFLMEIILNILLFCAMLVIGLQFFIRAHDLTAQTKELHQAVTGCESVASLFQNGDGTLEGLSDDISYSTQHNGWIRIYLDQNFNFCKKEDSSYYITAKLYSGGEDSLSKLRITCYNEDSKELYTLTVCRYSPLIHSTVAKEVS